MAGSRGGGGSFHNGNGHLRAVGLIVRTALGIHNAACVLSSSGCVRSAQVLCNKAAQHKIRGIRRRFFLPSKLNFFS